MPLRPTSFVGRQAERAQLASLIASSPLVTLVGPGGVGKTRLALEVAADQVGRWLDGVWLVELAALSDAALVPWTVGAVLGVQQWSGRELTADLVEWLRTKRLLLLLDNCEHVVEAAAQLVTQLVHTCPAVHILATSREVLGVDGETVCRVDPLAVPNGGHRSAQTVHTAEAVRLFVDRAVAAAPGFSLTDQNAAAVTHICERLDGLPLALELTAARLRLLSVEDVARRLDQRFDLLTSGSRAVLPRHRTLRALVDWSYDLLDDDERGLFEQLSVFSGGWTLDAVEAICTERTGTTLEWLGELIDKSLVHTESQPDGSIRYAMLETLREYAADRLRASGRAVDVQRRHARFYADAFTRWWGPVWWGEDADARLAHIAADYANVQTSLRWLIDHGEAAAAQRLAGSLTFFWLLRGRVEEGRRWLTAALALALSDATPGASAARFGAVVGLGQLAAVGGDRRAALAALEPELPTARERGDAVPLAQALTLAGWLVCWTRHDLASARAYLEEGARVAQTTGSRALEALARRGLASASAMAGDHAEAERLLDVNRALGYDPGQPLFGHTPMLLGALQYGQGRYAAAAAMLEEVSRQYDANRHPGNAMLALTILSWTRLAQGDLDAATTAAVEALTIVHSNLRRNLTPGHLGGPLEALAKVAAAAGDHARALRLEAAGATLRERHAILRSPGEHERLEHSLAPARAALGQRASAAASAAGRSLSVEEAVADALAFKPPVANPTC